MIAGLLAWLGTCTGVLALFSFADKAASPEGKVRARALLDFGWKDTVTQWPSVFVEMFDSIFGERHFTWKCIGRSCVASLAAVLLCTAISEWLTDDPVILIGSIRITIVGVWNPYGFLMFAVLINLIPDYFSLLQTRRVLRQLESGASWLGVLAWLVVDSILTFFLFFLHLYALGVLLRIVLVGEGLYIPDIWHFLRQTLRAFMFYPVQSPAGESTQVTFGIFLWSTYFTSVWLWLYALATFAGKLLLPILNRIEGFKKLVDLDNKPFLALGWLSVMIVTVLFALGAMIKACV